MLHSFKNKSFKDFGLNNNFFLLKGNSEYIQKILTNFNYLKFFGKYSLQELFLMPTYRREKVAEEVNKNIEIIF